MVKEYYIARRKQLIGFGRLFYRPGVLTSPRYDERRARLTQEDKSRAPANNFLEAWKRNRSGTLGAAVPRAGRTFPRSLDSFQRLVNHGVHAAMGGDERVPERSLAVEENIRPVLARFARFATGFFIRPQSARSLSGIF